MKSFDLVILGAGFHALVVADAALASGAYPSIAFCDKEEAAPTSTTRLKKITREISAPILSQNELEDLVKTHRAPPLVLGMGPTFLALRQRMVQHFLGLGFEFASVVHPSAILSPSVEIGRGVAVLAGTVLNPFAVIEDHAVINTGATVDHDCVIGRYSFIQPGSHLAGSVRVGSNSVVGIGASVREGTTIGENSFIGGGAFVNRDVPPGVVYAGVPARKLRDNTF